MKLECKKHKRAHMETHDKRIADASLLSDLDPETIKQRRSYG